MNRPMMALAALLLATSVDTYAAVEGAARYTGRDVPLRAAAAAPPVVFARAPVAWSEPRGGDDNGELQSLLQLDSALPTRGVRPLMDWAGYLQWCADQAEWDGAPRYQRLRDEHRSWHRRGPKVSAVPLPAGVWLLGSGIFALAGGFVRRRRGMQE